ncbi:MAG: LytR C-terminal domain-containing protein [candidate division Zixibacteria bacterium]|nr:LytR C-terminal domain-containing protein [candidate division Zixibacteria bacterium]
MTRSVELPQYSVRLEIENASGQAGLEKQITQELQSRNFNDMQLTVVEASQFKIRKAAKSFIISREENGDAAEQLALRLGLDPSCVIYRELEQNSEHISATLVLGKDFLMSGRFPARGAKS